MANEQPIFNKTGNQLGSHFSLAVVMYHQAVANAAGLNVTDYKCLSVIREHERMTPGILASLTGLSAAAVTTVVDRLEASGFAERQFDPEDRRRTVIVANSTKVEQEILPLMRSFFQSMGNLFSKYSQEELQLIVGFLVDTTDIFREETMKLRTGSGKEPGD